MTDHIQRFIFENTASRGAVVRLSKSVHDALAHHDYPVDVGQTLKKAMAVSCLLASTIKFAGKIIFQLQTDGKAPLILAQCTDKYHIRALARVNNDSPEASSLLGDGTLSIIISPDHSTERFQGVVDFHKEALTTVVERYFEQSEQLATKLYLASNRTDTVGLLLQRIPGNQYEDVETFEELSILANTLSDEELIAWDSETLLSKVFSEHDVRLFPSEVVKFQCSCSEHKIESVLISLGPKEIDEILTTHPYVEVHCDFCNKAYTFNREKIEEIFSKNDN